MDISKLIRKPSMVHMALEELPDGRVVAKEECKIYIPVRYAERKLAYIGTDVFILGFYAITVQDKYYGVSLLNTMVPIDPTETNKIKIQDEDYYEFVFIPGSTVYKTTLLIKTDVICYKVYNEFISLGHIPWFIGYDEMGKIFDSAKEFAGANLGTNAEVTELIASMLARDPKDRSKYYREIINTPADLINIKPIFVPLKSIQYAATNTLSKLGGNYFQQGVVSALISPSVRPERLESILLK